MNRIVDVIIGKRKLDAEEERQKVINTVTTEEMLSVLDKSRITCHICGTSRFNEEYSCSVCEEKQANDPPMIRICLHCRKEFDSNHKGNRICIKCKNLEKFNEGQLDEYNLATVSSFSKRPGSP